MVHDPKPPLQSQLTVLANSKIQNAFLFTVNAIFSRLPPSGGTWKYAKAPSTKKSWRDSLPIDMLLSAVSVLVVAQSSSEIPEGLMNNPVLLNYGFTTVIITMFGIELRMDNFSRNM